MVKKIIKYFFLTLLVLIIGALIVRIMISNDKSTFEEFEVTERSRSTYADNASLTVGTLALKDKISSSGYFCAYSLYYVEETGEIQVTVRYNTSAYGYTEVEGDGDFEFVLLNKKEKFDLSGSDSNKESSEEANLFKRYDGEYYRADSVENDTKYGLYVFKKLIFKDVQVSEDGFQADEFAVVMIPTGLELPSADADAVTRLSAYESIFDFQVVHFGDQPLDTYKLSKRDIQKLKNE